MAQFDVITLASGQWVIDVQADLLADLNTRLVVPLSLPREAPPAHPRLNPAFEIDGESYVMITQFASAVPVAEFGPTVASLRNAEYIVKNALGLLLSGV